jgi:hypothetical protein
MAYTINLTNGTIFATIPDGTINTSSSMTLVGKNYAGYGEFLDENFIHLLENGSNTTAPGAPLTGQLWWDAGNNLLKVYNGSIFKTISAATASSTQPSSNVTGDLWYDTSNQLLKVYTGTTFITVGPSVVAGTGVQTAVITDTLSATHNVIEFVVNNDVIGILSEDSAFTPGSSITGWGSGQIVKPGFNLSNASALYQFQGTANNANYLDNLDSTQFLRSDANQTTSGTLGVLNNTGFAVGLNQDFRASVSGTTVTLANQTSNGNLVIQVKQAGNTINAISINGSTGIVDIPSFAGNIAGGNVSVNNLINANGGNGVGNIGSSSNYFNTVFAKATSAQYADVAERFAIDIEQPPGTVVELGGSAEITCSLEELSESVFGVISTRAAYLMNSGAGTDATHPPIAMTGRVPVRVIGTVRKGDRLVSAGNGLARSAKAGEATAFNVIGRALADKLTVDEGTIEAIVTIK